MRPRPAIEPTFFSRYECKYFVDPMVASEMRNFLRPFAQPDAFAARRPGLRYPICSLYLDSADLGLYQQTVNGEKDRFKLRVRTYSDSSNDPAYFEVKRKINTVVHKRRAGLTRAMAAELLAERPVDLYDLQDRVREDVEYFNHHVSLTGARPGGARQVHARGPTRRRATNPRASPSTTTCSTRSRSRAGCPTATAAGLRRRSAG